VSVVSAKQSVRDQLVCPMSTKELATLILGMVEQVNSIDLYAYQRVLAFRIIESLLLNDGAVITALFSRQAGKSSTLSSVALALCIFLPGLANIYPNDDRLSMFKDGVWIGVFAPKLELSGPIYIKIRNVAESDHVRGIMSDPELNLTIAQSRGDSLAFSNGSIVKAQTASEQTINEGGTYHLVLIDEAQRVSKFKIQKEIGPMLSSTNGSLIKIGTAWMSRGGFHNDIQHNVAVQERGGARNHYQFDYEQVIAEKRALYNRQKREFEAGKRKEKPNIFHLKYEKWLIGELQRLAGNKDSEEFKMNFRLLWQESRMIAIKEVVLTSCALQGSEMNQPKHAGYQVASLDVAKSVDSTVLTVVEVERTSVIIDKNSRIPSGQIQQPQIYQRKLILGWLELQGSFEGIQYNGIQAFLKDYSVRYMLVDATGIGDPVCERLQVLLSGIEVEPFKYNTSSKSDLYKYYLQELEAQRVLYPAGALTQRSKEYQKFVQQHTDLEKEWHGSYMICHAPEGEHDDYPDSAAVAVWASRKIIEDNPMVEVEVESYNREDVSRRHPGVRGNSRESRYVRRRH